jgi:ABC-type amino acid transport substrate-binding protein
VLLFLIQPMTGHADTLRYAVTNESWEPYWVVRDGRVSGIFSDVMQALDQQMDVTLEAETPQPPLRAQKHFREAVVQLECCVSMAWRSAPEQLEVSLWSEPVLNTEEVLIFPPGRSFPFSRLQDLQGRVISTVRGYGYAGVQYFTRSDSPNSIAQLNSVARGRAEAGIIDRLELASLLASHPEIRALPAAVELGPVVSRSELRMRLHHSRADLLEPLNAAIGRLREDGTLATIVQRYAVPLRGEADVPHAKRL